MPLLGELKGDADAPTGSVYAPCVESSELGTIIQKEEIRKISRFYPLIEVWKVCMMPDHIHMIVRVKEDMPKEKHLGKMVCGLGLCLGAIT